MKPARMNGWQTGGLGVAVVFLCLSALTGCNAGNDTGELQAHRQPHISDIPIPQGFALVEERSRSYTNQAGLRWVDFLYKGREDKLEVIHFYEKQMLTSRWSPQMQQTAQGQTSLDFAKDHERCRITVSGGGALSATYIHISIAPGTHIGPPAKTKK